MTKITLLIDREFKQNGKAKKFKVGDVVEVENAEPYIEQDIAKLYKSSKKEAKK